MDGTGGQRVKSYLGCDVYVHTLVFALVFVRFICFNLIVEEQLKYAVIYKIRINSDMYNS